MLDELGARGEVDWTSAIILLGKFAQSFFLFGCTVSGYGRRVIRKDDPVTGSAGQRRRRSADPNWRRDPERTRQALRRYTARTLRDPAELWAQLAALHRTGTATLHGELTEEADSMATRILDAEGHVIAALSVVVRAGSVEHKAALSSVLASGLDITEVSSRRAACQVMVS